MCSSESAGMKHTDSRSTQLSNLSGSKNTDSRSTKHNCRLCRESTWDPEVFIIIIIIFPFWWLSFNKHSISLMSRFDFSCSSSKSKFIFKKGQGSTFDHDSVSSSYAWKTPSAEPENVCKTVTVCQFFMFASCIPMSTYLLVVVLDLHDIIRVNMHHDRPK